MTRDELLAALEAASGCLRRCADDVGLSRRHLYRLVYRERLEADVARIRQRAERERVEPEWLRRTRATLEDMSR